MSASAIATANTGAQVRLTAVPVDQGVVGAPGHNNTGSPVMCCRAERAVDPASVGLYKLNPDDPGSIPSGPSFLPPRWLESAWFQPLMRL